MRAFFGELKRTEENQFPSAPHNGREFGRIVIGGHPDFFGLNVIRDELNNAVGRELPFYTDMHELTNHAFITARQ